MASGSTTTTDSTASQRRSSAVATPSPPPSATMSPTPPPQTQTQQQPQPSSSQSSPFPIMVVAQHDFPGTGEDEITFHRGELVVVIAKDEGFGDGWWTGRTPSNQIGLFPAIYTLPYIPSSTPNTAETRPLSVSRDSPADTKKRSFSSGDSEPLYEGLGIHSEQAYAVDNPLNHGLSDVEEALGELSIQSSPSSVHSSDLYDQRRAGNEYNTEDDSSVSSGSENPILAQIRQWTPEEVAAFLVDRGFPSQAPNFVRHEISGAILLELDLAMLKEVDIVAFGVRFQIMREIEGLRRLGAPPEENRPSKQRKSSRDSGPHLPLRSPARSITSGEEDNIPPLRSPLATRSNHTSPTATPPPFTSGPRQHQRQSSYEPGTPRSATSPRPYSMSQDSGQGTIFEPRRSSKPHHRATQSQDSGFGGSTPDLHPHNPPTRPAHFRSQSSSTTGTDGPYQSGRIRVDSQDSGLGHSRHTSTDTIIRSPAKTGGHKRQSSSTVTVRAQPPSIPLMEAPGVKLTSQEEVLLPPSLPTNGTVTLPGTRSETPPNRPTAKFLIAPNSTRSPVPEKEKAVNGTMTENGVRLVKSYGQLRRRSSSTVESPSTPIDDGADLHSHRSILLKNVSAKDAGTTADYAGWLRKRTERGQSIAGLGGVGPGVGMVGGWKKRWFVLKGRRLSYYHSDKDAKEKGVIDITAHKCVTAVSAPNPSNSPTEGQSSTGPTRKISLTGSTKFIFKVVPPAPGTSRAVTFTPQKVHIFSAENEVEFRGWVEALMKANIGLDATAPVISSSTVPLISLARAKEMKSRPPALDLSDSHRSTPPPYPGSYVVTSDGGATKSTKPLGEPKSPPLPTPPLARQQSGESKGNFEIEMEKALGKVGKTPEIEKKQQLLELSIPIGLH